MDKKKKIIVISMIILGIIILGIVGTYAWYVWYTSDDDATNIVTSVGAATVTYDAGADLVGQSLRPVSSRTDGISKDIKIKTDGSSVNAITFNLYLDVNTLDDGLKHESFKYELYKEDTLKKSGDFSQSSLNTNLVTCSTNSTNHIVLLSNEEISTTESIYTLYIWIDGANYTNPDTMMNQNFSFKLHADGQNAVVDDLSGGNGTSGSTLVSTLTQKYLDANPTQATTANNGIYYYYAPSVGMMNDGMNSSHTWEDGVNAGNIRYYGATPSNYIDIGDRDSSGNVIPWRIIGVFKNMTLADGTTDTLVKVIREQPLSSDMKWDDDYNDWHNATLQTYLNTGGYYTGLSQSVKDKIAKVEWNLGGWNTVSGVYSNMIYEKERGSVKCSSCTYNTIWEGDIALMYPSDYGYAADLTKCSKVIYNYNKDTTNCTGTDWLFNSKNQWLLTPSSSTALDAWAVNSSGYVSGSAYVADSDGVRPVLYLSSELGIESGDGITVESAYVVR